jgi:hypothetical protein
MRAEHWRKVCFGGSQEACCGKPSITRSFARSFASRLGAERHAGRDGLSTLEMTPKLDFVRSILGGPPSGRFGRFQVGKRLLTIDWRGHGERPDVYRREGI